MEIPFLHEFAQRAIAASRSQVLEGRISKELEISGKDGVDVVEQMAGNVSPQMTIFLTWTAFSVAGNDASR